MRFGITPVMLDSDVAFLADLTRYLTDRLQVPVALEQRRTYQEITALLLSGQIDAAWICGYPYVQHRDHLALIAVPIWRGEPLYQSYLLVRPDDPAERVGDLRGQIHAFSDPDSNSGFLVTRWMLHEIGETPDAFFRSHFFTYGHRNVVRAVASGLAQSGSVDGYVWEVLSALEPDLTEATRVLHRSQKLGFPPVACLASRSGDPGLARLKAVLTGMGADDEGRALLSALQLDGFADVPEETFDGIQALYDEVRGET